LVYESSLILINIEEFKGFFEIFGIEIEKCMNI